MPDDLFARAERLYHAALDLPPARRAGFLREASHGDEALLREVEEMLEVGDRTGGFLESPALEIALGAGEMTTGRLRRAFAAAMAGGEFRLAPGARLGPYEIVEPIGAGGMGEIYRACDKRLGRAVAVKILAAGLMHQAEIRRRFETEAQAISKLNHPHICTLYDIGAEGDIDYLVMEYLEGQTLAERLKRGPLPYAETVRVALEVASALAYAHARGVVHRDLKPGNIMLTALGAKLLDFGLARWEQEAELLDAVMPAGRPQGPDAALTVTGLILGTPQYMAPEQIERRTMDARTDIFALGAVIYEMASGHKAFTGVSSSEVMRAILTAEPPSIPGPLNEVVRGCLVKSPEARWQSAAELAQRLQRLTGGEGLAPTRWVRMAGIAAVLAALGLSAGDPGAATRQSIRFRYDTKLETLHSFPMQGELPSNPASLVRGPDGTLYGTTQRDGGARAGTVFALDAPRSGSGPWSFRTLYTFAGGSDGAVPSGPVTVGQDGKLYGTTEFGGINGNGTVYELTPAAAPPGGVWRERVLHHFLRRDGDGCDPGGRLVFGRAGELYGTTQTGGVSGQGFGTVFRLTPPAQPGGNWSEEVLYRFTGGSDTGDPFAGLIQTRDGLYGATDWATGAGAVFNLAPSAAAGWKLTVLYKFDGKGGEGNAPGGDLAAGDDGSLYGASFGVGGLGAVFKLTPPRLGPQGRLGPWVITCLHRFRGRNGDGSNASDIVFGPKGTIYGATKTGGFSDKGTIYQLQPPATPGGPWAETVLHSFSGAPDGDSPLIAPALVVGDGGRALYGATTRGGALGGGMVFRLRF